MTELDKSEGHCRCCSKRDRSKRTARWLGLLAHVVYEIARNWPW
ncbi:MULTISPECIES: hypothetical protein [unclassified Streptomyces]|nr:hypothetical protein [Streptomyces sp. MUSC 125]